MVGAGNQKLFAIGDIHGCHERLELLLDRIPFRAGVDQLVFIGDLINRGSNSFRVIETINKISEKNEVICLLGNHEHLVLEYQSSLDPKLVPFLRESGIEATLESYNHSSLNRLSDLAFMPKAHQQTFYSLKPYWETDSYIFVHAGISPELPLADQSIEQMVSDRNFHNVSDDRLNKTVIFGHTPFLTPFVTEKKIGIDTGAVYDNMLTAVELPDRVFYHA